MNKHLIPLAVLLFGSILIVHAQGKFTCSPEKPNPGDKIIFSYTPPANLFGLSDTINCEARKWGVYEDQIVYETGVQNKPVFITLLRKGNTYEGSLPTDSLTRAVTFNFTSGKVKFTRDGNKLKLAKGKVDVNDSLGYCVPFYGSTGTECRYSNYFIAGYLSNSRINNIGISNNKEATRYLLRELEIYPDMYDKVWSYLPFTLGKSDPEDFQKMVTNELNKIFDTGINSGSDYKKVARFTSYLKLKGMSKYFSKQGMEKFKEDSWYDTMSALWDKFTAEQDITKKAALMNQYIEKFEKSSYEDKTSIAGTGGSPRGVRLDYMAALLQKEMLDEYKKYRQQYNLTPETTPFMDSKFINELDTLLAHNKFPEFTEKKALEYLSYYKGNLRLLDEGKPIQGTTDVAYYTPAMQKMSTLRAIITFSDFCSAMYKKYNNDKKAFSYAKDALNYYQMYQPDSPGDPDLNTSYSLLAEKVLPQNETKAEVEKMVASGEWKPEMIEVLKRIYVNEKKTEAGFEEYIKTIKKAQTEELKKSLIASMLNEPAPAFTLSDLEGKQVSLESLKGKIVILDFWATWCGPCKASFPGMQKLQEYYKDRSDIKILFMNTMERYPSDKEKHDKVQEYITKNNYPFHVVLDNKSKVSADYKVSGIPTKCIIDKQGNLRYRIAGAETNPGKLLDEMNAMIESIN